MLMKMKIQIRITALFRNCSRGLRVVAGGSVGRQFSGQIWKNNSHSHFKNSLLLQMMRRFGCTSCSVMNVIHVHLRKSCRGAARFILFSFINRHLHLRSQRESSLVLRVCLSSDQLLCTQHLQKTCGNLSFISSCVGVSHSPHRIRIFLP